MALIPAAICGYCITQYERGGLLAFWYPAMLCGCSSSSTARRRARSPRVARCRSSSGSRRSSSHSFAPAKAAAPVALRRSTPPPDSAKDAATKLVLRASPMRGLGQLAWTGVIGGGTLLLAAWIAPKLWQKDRDIHHQEPLVVSGGALDSVLQTEERRRREDSSEYLPIHGSQPSSLDGRTVDAPQLHAMPIRRSQRRTSHDRALWAWTRRRRADDARGLASGPRLRIRPIRLARLQRLRQ